MSYYTQSLSPETEARPKAIFYTTLLAVVVLALLWFSHLSLSPASQQLATARLDSVQLAYIPLNLTTRSHAVTPLKTLAPTGRSAAPKARWTPTPREARPNAAPLPGNTRPIITHTEPSPVEEPKIDERGLYHKTEKPGNGTKPNAKAEEGGSPKGQPNGTNAGPNGTGGIGLDLSGFRFGQLSVKADPYDETGRIVFVVKVDATGHILSLSVSSTNVSPTVVNWYRDQLQRIRLIPTSSGERPEISTGQISLKITSR